MAGDQFCDGPVATPDIENGRSRRDLRGQQLCKYTNPPSKYGALMRASHQRQSIRMPWLIVQLGSFMSYQPIGQSHLKCSIFKMLEADIPQHLLDLFHGDSRLVLVETQFLVDKPQTREDF